MDTASTVRLLRQLDDEQRRDLIDACLQAVVHNDRAGPEYSGRLVKLAAMIGEPDDTERVATVTAVRAATRTAVIEEICAWLDRGDAFTTGNRILTERIRQRFLHR